MSNAQLEAVKSGKTRKILKLCLFAVANIGIVVYIAVKEFGPEARGVQSITKLDINMAYLIFAVACFGAAALMETLKYRSMMITATDRADLRGAYECAVLGKYYDNITPLGSGGQPFQIYYLKKRGLPNGACAALPIAGFLVLQTAFVLVAFVVFIFNGGVAENVAAIKISAYIGLAFYMFVPFCVVLLTITPKAFGVAVRACVKVLHKVRIIKDYDVTAGKIFSSLDEYRESLKILWKSPRLLFKLLMYSIVYQVAVLSIPFFVLRAFGGTHSWWMIFSLMTFIYSAIAIIPTPGNSGAAEGSFYAVFSTLTSGNLFWGVVVWRVLCYYSWLAAGLIIITGSAIARKSVLRKKA
ncbi:MAG: flippase-like domain-containing protein [Clostridiales bacterium]|jgi:uncharacterized protein (TIRG00374 family)|nr:flippase-like domain-containing protein [Clostridiales bacterium]